LAVAAERPRLVPGKLRPGDRIGIISPSAPVGAYPRRVARGLENLRALGFEPVLGRHALSVRGHLAGSVVERLDDLHSMFADRSIKAIVATTGGFNANQLLEAIDWDLIAGNPKIFLGYSDITVLLVAIWTRTGLCTVVGPSLLPQFGEIDGLHPYTAASFRRTLMSAAPVQAISPARESIVERLYWDAEDDRPRQRQPHPGPRVLRAGTVHGPLIAANIGTMLTLAGTYLWPRFDGALLFLEEDEVESPGTIDRMLTHLRQIGVFDRIAGLAFGRFHPDVGLNASALDEIVFRAVQGSRFPIVADLDFGHVDPMFLLPLGVRAEIDARDEARVSLLEAAVSER
jgi:muramoyltetrapeptide carboxypeptidase